MDKLKLMRSAIRMADDTLANGGATYFLQSPRATAQLPLSELSLVPAEDYSDDQYVIGGVVPELVVSGDNAADLAIAISKFANTNEAHLRYLHAYYRLGTWLNEDTGMVHIDIVSAASGIAMASSVAKLRGELAIYHPASDKSIPVAN